MLETWNWYPQPWNWILRRRMHWLVTHCIVIVVKLVLIYQSFYEFNVAMVDGAFIFLWFISWTTFKVSVLLVLEWTGIKNVTLNIGWAKEGFWLLGVLPSNHILKSRIPILRSCKTTCILISKGKIFKWLCVWHKLGLNGKVLWDTLGGGALHTSRCSICWIIRGDSSAMYRRILSYWRNLLIVGKLV